jgi:CheY-like chemotaxis protein
MRILVVGEDAEARGRLHHSLQSNEREVIEATVDGAEAEIQRQEPDVLLLLLPDVGSPELLRTLCAAGTSGGMYVIGVTAEHQPARTISSAVAAGSHDVLCAPYTTQELRACVDVQRRLRRWMSTRLRVLGKVEPQKSKVDDLRAWHYLGDVIADDLETMLGRSLVIEEDWPTFTDSIQLATISMTLASEQLELCISIVADTTTRRWLGETLLGDAAAADESIDDVMREMANVAGGALKRAALIEGPVLTTGIPVDGRSLPVRESGARCWTMPLDGGASVAVIGEIRRRANRRIPARRLCEGMVVVADVRNQVGTLLVPSGTRLTLTTAERLSNLLDSALIEISG